MKFHKERVYSQKNIRDLMVGCIIIGAHTLKDLKHKIEMDEDGGGERIFCRRVLSKKHFSKKCVIAEFGEEYEYAYLICLYSNVSAWEYHFYAGQMVYIEENGVYVAKQDIPLDYWGEKRIFLNPFSDICIEE